MQTIIIISVLALIIYLVISSKIRYNHQNQKISIDLYHYSSFIFPKASREGILANLINEERTNKMLNDGDKLLIDSDIVSIAKFRAEELAKNNAISHRGASKAFIQLNEMGSDGSAEILAYGYGYEEAVIYGWLRSEAHRKAMLNPLFDYFGVSCVKDSKNKWVDVVIFVNENTI